MAIQSDDLKHELIIRYLPLVKYIAGRLAVRLPPVISQDDLEGYGVFGLIDAVEKYNPDKGANFKSYASKRIHGSMVDELRKFNWIPRTLYSKLREMVNTREDLEKRYGGSVSQEEIADELGISVDQLHVLSTHLTRVNVLSLEREISPGDGDGTFLGHFLEDGAGTDPLQELIEKEDSEILSEMVGELEERDQLILALHYKERLTLKEIGCVLDITESRVCQLHARVLEKLRRKMRLAYK